MNSFLTIDPASGFPIQNLPYGVFHIAGEAPRACVAIGEWILDLAAAEKEGLLEGTGVAPDTFSQSSLNCFMAQGKTVWQAVRRRLQELLSAADPVLRDNAALRERLLVSQKAAHMLLPAQIGDYTDFYASKEHATNVGTMFRGKENALLPNWTSLPVGYHGRASSVVVSGTDVRRPCGQMKRPADPEAVFGPTGQLDLELEVGWLIGPGNEQGSPVALEEAEDQIFGLVLVNDWSARDIQAWEYQPLGPFLAKSFATSISPWVVPLEALEPFRAKGPEQKPEPLPYLRSTGAASFDIKLEAYMKTEKMTGRERIISTNFQHLYWSMGQQIAHHTIGGCNLRPGDLLASGTISGPDKESRGSMLELTWRGEDPVQLSSGEERSWIEDGDEVTVTGWCQGDGYRIGFGEVSGRILPAMVREEIKG